MRRSPGNIVAPYRPANPRLNPDGTPFVHPDDIPKERFPQPYPPIITEKAALLETM
jgi:hypothetical protein